jgi:D-alanyl-D-alanine dipeptidase
LLVVQTANWNTSTGTFRRYQSSASSVWELVGEPFPVNVGRNGLAWSQGLHAKPGRGPLKREGDGRSPAGIFDLDHAFGYSADPPEGARGFPYLPIDRDTVCVEDVRSKDYNRILDVADSTGTGWERRSVMLRPDGLFRWGVVVSQNTPAVQPGSGSCVFLHVWKGPGRPTAGCTAMSADRIEEIVRWLDPDGNPSLVQLPEAEYSELRESLQLP